jgi:hypothetical protein
VCQSQTRARRSKLRGTDKLLGWPLSQDYLSDISKYTRLFQSKEDDITILKPTFRRAKGAKSVGTFLTTGSPTEIGDSTKQRESATEKHRERETGAKTRTERKHRRAPQFRTSKKGKRRADKSIKAFPSKTSYQAARSSPPLFSPISRHDPLRAR